MLMGTAKRVSATGYFKDAVSYVCGASRSHVYLDKEIGIENLDVNNGYWLLIHSDQFSRVNPDDKTSITEDMILEKVSNAFGLVGRPYGAYELVFVSTQDQQCGIKVDGMAHLKLNILPPAEHLYIGEICASSGAIILNDILEELMPSFNKTRDEIAWTRYRLDNNNKLVTDNSGLNVSTGELELSRYLGAVVTVNFSVIRKFNGIEIQNCSEGSITFEVVESIGGREDVVNTVPFCIESLPDVVSLNELVGLGFPSSGKGAWSNSAGITIIDGNKVALKQEVKKYITNNGSRPSSFEFILDRSKLGGTCNLTGTERLIINFVNSNFKMESEVNLSDACQFANPYINLYEGMGLALPSNAGTWTVEPAIAPEFFSDGRVVTIGMQEGDYTFTYVIDETVDDALACAVGISTVKVNFKFNEDDGLKGTSIQVCQDRAKNINLYNLLINKNYNTRPDDGYWELKEGKNASLRWTRLTSAQALNVDLSGKPNTAFTYRFTDNTENFCGDNQATVYITKKRNLIVNSQTTAMCYLFNTADTFNLVAFSGLSGICGTWSWSGINAANVVNANNTSATSGSATSAAGLFFLAHNEYITNPPSGVAYKKYKFTFTVGSGCGGCGLQDGESVDFYVIITDDLVRGLP